MPLYLLFRIRLLQQMHLDTQRYSMITKKEPKSFENQGILVLFPIGVTRFELVKQKPHKCIKERRFGHPGLRFLTKILTNKTRFYAITQRYSSTSSSVRLNLALILSAISLSGTFISRRIDIVPLTPSLRPSLRLEFAT